MSSLTILGGLVALASLAGTNAQAITGTYPPVPIASKHFEYNQLPYKVDTDVGLVRGVQRGYNLCNQTTENQESLCQTSIVNSLDDFCLWAPSEPDSVVGNTEGEMVAWCTKPGHGTRLMPEGTLTGVQFVKTPDYISLVGFLDQTKINIQKEDWGGEMDPHGADLRGNPMGGVMFSNAFGGGYKQVIEWHNFMGGNAFCLKACDPAGPNAAHFCEHIFDRIGCAYNVPNNAQDNKFESCLGENQDFPGVYTDASGAVVTYKQPDEALGAITTMPYTARIPATTSCTTFDSTAIYTGLPKATNVAAAGPSGASGAPSGSGSGSVGVPSGSLVKSTVKGSATGSAATAGSSKEAGEPGSAGRVGLSVGVVAAVAAVVGFVGLF